MDDHRIPGEVSAAAHAFPDHGLASSADLPLAANRSPVDDPNAQGRAWPHGAAAGGSEWQPGNDDAAQVNPRRGPFSRRGPLAANGRDATIAPTRDARDDAIAPTRDGRDATSTPTGSDRDATIAPTRDDRGRRRGRPWLDAGRIGVLSAYGIPDTDGVSQGTGTGIPSPGALTAAWQPPEPASLHARSAPQATAPSAGRARREVWTDLAVERIRAPERIPGVAVEEDHRGLLQISRVRIESEEAELRVGKRRGRYITLEAPGLRRRNAALQEDTARALADELRSFLPEAADAEILVVGLGNWNATPDALGPRVVADLLITRHLREQVPEDLRGGLRSLCAVAPGVLGTTGIETGEIIRAIVDRIHPDAMIAVDALASRSIDRIAATIQLADTGIHPGSGVGNDRGDLSSETLGVPVIAVGVPTVVHAFTIASDTVDLLIQRIPRRPEFAGLRAMDPEEKRRLIAEVLTPSVGDLMVTPKEIDVLIEDMSRIIAAAINAAVHPKIAQQPTLF